MSFPETTWFPSWHRIHMMHWWPWHQSQFLSKGWAVWLYYLQLWVPKLHPFKKACLQVPKLDKYWSCLFVKAWGGSIFRRVSFYIVLAFGTQVVIWPNSGDCPQHLVLVRQNSSFWTLCKRSLKNWCWGWMKQACILPVCGLPCVLCLPTDFHVLIWWIWSGD